MMLTKTRDYQVKFAEQINAGYSARLNAKGLSENPHIDWLVVETEDGANRRAGPLSDKAQAWQHGWHNADRHSRLTR